MGAHLPDRQEANEKVFVFSLFVQRFDRFLSYHARTRQGSATLLHVILSSMTFPAEPSVYGSRDTLLRLCHYEFYDQLPNIHHGTHLQLEVQEAAETLGYEYARVTTTPWKALEALTERHMETYYRKDAGLLPFSMCPPGASVIRRMVTPGMVRDPGRSSFYEGYIPLDWHAAELQLECYAPFLGAILGTEHPNVVGYQEFLWKYQQLAP